MCKEKKPKLLIAGASSYPRSINYPQIYSICQKYNTLLLADISHTAIYIAAQSHTSPFGYADFVTFTTHKTTRGIRGGIVMCKNNIDHALNMLFFRLFKVRQNLMKSWQNSNAKRISIYGYKRICCKYSKDI